MNIVSSHFSRFVVWIRTHRLQALIIGGAMLLLVAGGVAYAILAQPHVAPTFFASSPKPKPPAPKYYSPLNGVEIPSADDAKKPITAIMIENSPDARPQSGLKQAEVVYEAIAEGGITRFLALYQQHKPGLIGPVRSLRMYYLDWAAPYRPGIVHIGGSAAALAEVRNGNYMDLDEFFNSGSFWRARDRAAPHNVYTNFERLDALNARKNNISSNLAGLPRSDSKPSETPDATAITVNFSGPSYNTNYTYDKTANSYARSVGGQAHDDREEGRIAPQVVIAMHVNMTRVLEDGYRESITTTGNGQVETFQNGTVHKGTWQKASRSEPLQFLDADGKPISLVRGQTWIAAVPNTAGGVSWQ